MKREDELSRELSRVELRLAHLLNRLEKINLAEYLELFRDPGRLFWMNLIAGMGRGVGAAIGFTLITAVILYMLQRIVRLNLPLISDFLVHVINLVRQRGGF